MSGSSYITDTRPLPAGERCQRRKTRLLLDYYFHRYDFFLLLKLSDNQKMGKSFNKEMKLYESVHFLSENVQLKVQNTHNKLKINSLIIKFIMAQLLDS